MSNTLNWILEWHRRACPEPTIRQFEVQLGCHLEEIAEMLESFEMEREDHLELQIQTQKLIQELSNLLKSGAGRTRYHRVDRDGLLDSLADQVVTAIGAGYRADTNILAAIDEVDRSNWTKFSLDGHPILDANGKILKGPNYQPPKLEGFY